MTTVSETITRPGRGLAQGGAGYVIVDCLDEFTRWEPTTRQYGLAVIVVGAVVSFIQNTGENRGWWKAIGRTVPPTEAKLVDHVDEPGKPEQTDNRERPEDGEQPPDETWDFTGAMR